jgi:hypothetical protein
MATSPRSSRRHGHPGSDLGTCHCLTTCGSTPARSTAVPPHSRRLGPPASSGTCRRGSGRSRAPGCGRSTSGYRPGPHHLRAVPRLRDDSVVPATRLRFLAIAGVARPRTINGPAVGRFGSSKQMTSPESCDLHDVIASSTAVYTATPASLDAAVPGGRSEGRRGSKSSWP